MTDPAHLRKEYTTGSLDRSDLLPDPLRQFERWFSEALSSGIEEANPMVLSTVDESGAPSARVVLLKGVESDAFVFFTNTRSRKGREIAGDPRVSLTFFWGPLERQIRVEGTAEPVERAVSIAYFATRPRESQIAAWASAQSEEVASRQDLEAAYRRFEEKFHDGPVPCSDHWGGFRVVPSAVEFWQGRPGRLHDRFRYTKKDGWNIVRLAP